MSRKGNCLDNAPAEAFFARLKTELNFEPKRNSGLESLRKTIADYILWWNTERIVSKLHTSPIFFRQQYELTV